MSRSGKNNRLSLWYQNIRSELNVYAGISFGVFLFILFFQPFNLETLDFNDRLLFIAGMGAIVFVLITLIRSGFSISIQSMTPGGKELHETSYLSGFIFLVFNTVAFAFYLRYVGSVSMSFYLVFKIFLISLAPPLINSAYDVIKELKRQSEELREEIRQLQEKLTQNADKDIKSSVQLVSLNSAEKLSVAADDVLMIRSADNYVEIYYLDNSHLKKKMLRNTLKNIEYQLAAYPSFLRCHRTSIVNVDNANNLTKRYNTYFLDINMLGEPVPVSRQYLIRIKEALSLLRDE